MRKIRARELGFDACMYMLHKTFGALRLAAGELWVPMAAPPSWRRCPSRSSCTTASTTGSTTRAAQSIGKIREFWGNIPQVLKAYAWARAMGAEGINEASDLSVLANNYMERKLLRIRGIEKSHPQLTGHRLEMTRYGWGPLKADTGIGTAQVANRMADYGIDPYWMSREPLGGAGAVHAGGRRDVRQGGSRHLDRGPRAHLARGLYRARAGADGTAPPADPPDRRRAAGGPGTVGDDLASLSCASTGPTATRTSDR